MTRIATLVALVAGSLSAQPATPPASNPLQSLRFLEGTWDARASAGTAAAAVSGSYTFRMELSGHVLARHSTVAGCKAPADFNCEHLDLLYIYPDGPARKLNAIYFDNEGHVLHYDVSAPGPNSAVFLSDSALPGPQFRLSYELKDAMLSGKFQMRMSGQTEWKSYLEWSGGRK